MSVRKVRGVVSRGLKLARKVQVVRTGLKLATKVYLVSRDLCQLGRWSGGGGVVNRYM